MVTKAVVLKFGNLSLNFIGLFIVEYRFFGNFFETWFFNITLRALQGHVFDINYIISCIFWKLISISFIGYYS